MSEHRDPSDRANDDFASMLSELRARAETLTGDQRAIALEHLHHLEREAQADRPSASRMQAWLSGLQVIAPLTPLIERALEALSNVGL